MLQQLIPTQLWIYSEQNDLIFLILHLLSAFRAIRKQPTASNALRSPVFSAPSAMLQIGDLAEIPLEPHIVRVLIGTYVYQ